MAKINLVLSGGGARGIAHLGVIKALLEYGIEINQIAGVSMGSIMGAFIADGYSPDDALKIISEQRLFSLFSPIFRRGLFSMHGLEKGLNKFIKHKTIESLNIPLTIYATCVQNGQLVAFDKGDIVKPIVASSSIPGLFEPMLIDGKQYIDGGVLNNLPIECFMDLAEPLVAVHVNPPYISHNLNSTMKVMSRVAELIAYKTIEKRKFKASILVEPPRLKMFAIHDLKRAKEIFQVGYEYTKSIKEEILTLF